MLLFISIQFRTYFNSSCDFFWSRYYVAQKPLNALEKYVYLLVRVFHSLRHTSLHKAKSRIKNWHVRKITIKIIKIHREKECIWGIKSWTHTFKDNKKGRVWGGYPLSKQYCLKRPWDVGQPRETPGLLGQQPKQRGLFTKLCKK